MNLKKNSEDTINEAVMILKKGGVIIAPTDTNYNVLTNIHSKEGVDRIFKMKKRNAKSPLTLFLGNALEVNEYAYSTPLVDYLMKTIWPSQISFILWRKSTLPAFITCDFPTVAVTLHENLTLKKIANGLNMPLAGTSANLSGTGTVPDIKKAVEHIGSEVDLIIDGGLSPINNSNTIIDFTLARPVVARNGAFPVEKILPFIPDLDVSLTNYKEFVSKRIESEWSKIQY